LSRVGSDFFSGPESPLAGVNWHRTAAPFQSLVRSTGICSCEIAHDGNRLQARVHGRDAELALIRTAFRHRLAEGGIKVGSWAADPSETAELASLLAAFFDRADPLLDPANLSTLRAQHEHRLSMLCDLQ
jgi:hypothetical protein